MRNPARAPTRVATKKLPSLARPLLRAAAQDKPYNAVIPVRIPTNRLKCLKLPFSCQVRHRVFPGTKPFSYCGGYTQEKLVQPMASKACINRLQKEYRALLKVC